MLGNGIWDASNSPAMSLPLWAALAWKNTLKINWRARFCWSLLPVAKYNQSYRDLSDRWLRRLSIGSERKWISSILTEVVNKGRALVIRHLEMPLYSYIKAFQKSLPSYSRSWIPEIFLFFWKIFSGARRASPPPARTPYTPSNELLACLGGPPRAF